MTLIAAGSLSLYGAGCAAQAGSMAGNERHPSIEILMLSRGRGVPPETRTAFERMKDMIALRQREGAVLASEQSVFGLEGETRLCVVFKDETSAREARSELAKLGEAVDLLQIREAACEPR